MPRASTLTGFSIIALLLFAGCVLGSGEPELTDFNLQVEPQGRDAPLTATARVSVTNDGGAEETATLRLDNEPHKEIAVPAGETVERTVELTVHYGTHTVAYGPETASVDADGLTFEHPETVQVDEPFGLTVKALPASDDLTLHLSSSTYEEERWANEVPLDTSDHQAELPPDELMRLIQLMTPVSDEANGAFFQPIESMGDTWQLRMAAQRAGTTLDETAVERQWGDPEVSTSEVEAEGVVGTLYEPPGDGPAPPVVLLHGSKGTTLHHPARMLASHEFLALTLPYFGKSSEIPDHLDRVPIEYVQRAGEWLLQHERASGDQVGLWGASRGGELALLAASHFEVFGAVVAVAGSGVAWGGWTHNGEPVAQLLSMHMRGSEMDGIDEDRLAEATIPVERINGPVLMISGRGDRLWNAVTFSGIAVERLERHDHPYSYQHLVYDEAGHGIAVPYLPMPTAVSGEGYPRNFGGTREGVQRPPRTTGPRALKFLRFALTEDESTDESR